MVSAWDPKSSTVLKIAFLKEDNRSFSGPALACAYAKDGLVRLKNIDNYDYEAKSISLRVWGGGPKSMRLSTSSCHLTPLGGPRGASDVLPHGLVCHASVTTAPRASCAHALPLEAHSMLLVGAGPWPCGPCELAMYWQVASGSERGWQSESPQGDWVRSRHCS